MIRMTRYLLTKFRRDTSGTSAIEFAIIAPVLIACVVALSDVNDVSYRSASMESAVRAGTQYALKGGTDPTVAQTLANAAWTNKPGNGTLTASKVCKCAGLAHDCTTLCPDFNPSQMFMTVTATGTVGGNYISFSKTATQTVRVR